MIVHHKVSTLLKFDTLTPNYMLMHAQDQKRGFKWYRIHGTISASFLIPYSTTQEVRRIVKGIMNSPHLKS